MTQPIFFNDSNCTLYNGPDLCHSSLYILCPKIVNSLIINCCLIEKEKRL